MRILLTTFMLGISLLAAHAQSWKAHTYDAERGIPSEIVKDLTSDQWGFLWVASDDGLARFDGLEFQLFRKELSSVYAKQFIHLRDGRLLLATDLGIDQINSYPDTTIISNLIPGSVQVSDSTVSYPKSIYEASNGTLWIGEPKHVLAYRNGRLHRYFLGAKAISNSFTISFNFTEDEEGVVWASSYSGNIYHYDKLEDQFVELVLSRTLSNITDFVYMGHATWLIGSYEGLFKLEVTRDKGKLTRVSSLPWVKCMQQLPNGHFYIGTRNAGTYEAKWQSDSLSVTHFKATEGLYINSIYCPSQQGMWWMATNEGIVFMEERFFNTIELEGKRPTIHDIASWKKDHVIVAEGRHVYLLSNQGGEWLQETIWDYDGSYVMALDVQDDRLWMGMSSGALYHLRLPFKGVTAYSFGHEDPTIAHTLAVHATRNGRQVWASKTNTVGVYRLDVAAYTHQYATEKYGEEHGFRGEVTIVRELDNGDLLMGSETDSAYLFLYDSSADSVLNKSQPIPIECYEDFKVLDMQVLDDSVALLATTCGLWRINFRQGLFPSRMEGEFHVKNTGLRQQGLEVMGVVEDNKQGLWFASKQGVNLRMPGFEQVLFDEASGLAAKSLKPRTLVLDKQNRLWVGTVKGVSMVDLQKANMQRTPAPIIKAVQINEKKVPLHNRKGMLEVDAHAYLQIDYAPVIYPGEEVHYQSRLLGVGLDSAWSDFNRSAHLLLPVPNPGEYVLEMRSQHMNGYHWSKPCRLPFVVVAPWYQQWWALLLYLLLGYIGVSSIVRWNTWRLLRSKRKLAQAVRERMAESIAHQQLLNKQKEELAEQRDYIRDRNQELEEAQKTIGLQNHQLTESNHRLEEKVRQRTAELHRALEEVKKSHAELDYFIYRSAHDLRGPIARVSGLASVLRRMVSNDPQEQQCVDHLAVTASHMGQMLDRLLHTLDVKSTQPTWEAVPLKTCVEQIVANFEAAGQLAATQVYYEGATWPYVSSDALLLRRLLENLIKNAIDFQDPYRPLGIHLSAKVHGEQVFLQIIDEGKGVDKKAQEKIFELFYIGSEYSTGAGLGLYEASVIAGKLRGNVRLLESRPGKTVFEVQLPLG